MKKIIAFMGLCLISKMVLAASLPSDLKPNELRVYGDKNNATTIYTFSSLTCPHCSAYHKKIMPLYLENYVDTNKAKLVYVEMPYDTVAMTGTMLSRCIAPDQHEAFMDTMFSTQAEWAYSPDARRIMSNYMVELGASTDSVNECLANNELRKEILAQRTNLAKLYNVKAMPTTVVVKNGEILKLQGTDAKALIKDIDAFLKD